MLLGATRKGGARSIIIMIAGDKGPTTVGVCTGVHQNEFAVLEPPVGFRARNGAHPIGLHRAGMRGRFGDARRGCLSTGKWDIVVLRITCSIQSDCGDKFPVTIKTICGLEVLEA
jgi:hypothetical protein